MNKQPKVIHLKIEKDMKMFVSEWVMFMVGMGFIAVMFIPILRIISDYPDDAFKIALLLIFVYAFTKIVMWVKVPTTYSTNDIVEEIRLELNRK